MKEQKKWLVIGAGFRGIIGSYLLAKKTKDNILLVDKAPQLGGILNATYHNGYYLDKGCHLFGNDGKQITEMLLDIFESDIISLPIHYASIFHGKFNTNFAIPDFSTLGDKTSEKILLEIIQASSKNKHKNIQNLFQQFEYRHGHTAAELLTQAVKKMYQISAHELEQEALELMPFFKRIKFIDDDIGTLLKESKVLDQKIAVSSVHQPMKFVHEDCKKYDFKTFYPAQKGLQGFSDKAAHKLNHLGVQIKLKTGIHLIEFKDKQYEVHFDNGNKERFDKILWASAQENIGKIFGINNNLQDYIHKVPMVLYYFFTDKSNVSKYAYIQNFDLQDTFFRVSIPTNYGTKNAPEGKAYICCEVPVQLDNSIWKNPDQYKDRLWQEMYRYKIVHNDELPEESLVLKTPVSYKVPKVGFKRELDSVIKQIPNRKNIIGLENWEFTKSSIIENLLMNLQAA